MMRQPIINDLMPCPWCGRDELLSIYWEDADEDAIRAGITCWPCQIDGPTGRGEYEDRYEVARNAWNRRPPAPVHP